MEHGNMHKFRWESGSAEMGAGNTVEVATNLRTVVRAFALHSEAPGAATQMLCDKTISSGCVTFADGGVASKTFDYILFGYA